MTVSKLTERLGLRVGVDTDWNKQRAATTRQAITRIPACCKVFLKKKQKSLSRQCSVLAFFKSSSGVRASPPVLVDIDDVDLHHQPADKEELNHLYKAICLSDFVPLCHYSSFLVITDCLKPASPF